MDDGDGAVVFMEWSRMFLSMDYFPNMGDGYKSYLSQA